MYQMLGRIRGSTYSTPNNCVLDNAGYTSPTQQHGLDHTDRTYHTDHTDHTCPEIYRHIDIMKKHRPTTFSRCGIMFLVPGKSSFTYKSALSPFLCSRRGSLLPTRTKSAAVRLSLPQKRRRYCTLLDMIQTTLMSRCNQQWEYEYWPRKVSGVETLAGNLARRLFFTKTAVHTSPGTGTAG